MNNSTLTKVINYLVEGLIMFFLIIVLLFITGDKYSDELSYRHIEDMLFGVIAYQTLISFIVIRIRYELGKATYQVIVGLIYASIVTFILYAISGRHDNIEYARLPLLWLCMEIAWVIIMYMLEPTQKMMKNEENKVLQTRGFDELNKRFGKSGDVSTDQKYAIISLLAFLQGASPQSAFNDEANKIVQSTISSLGLTKEEAEKHIKASMNRNPDQEIDKIMHALKEMQNPDSITDLQRKCMRIAEISGQAEMIEVIKNIFAEIRSK
ncbi:hypothetical protein Bacsa_1697 [Phocaeicola salanitronis DSM 18170]|uniref:Transmembrane protein n=1 Tax=Phocaeicola salanitronis (strain DSM 18170 / JCM 13657 / CCUG 60908 / BL78) TaxID=667015 RepID=F0R0Q6_PHOSB|nr:hypothetical protein [Phocaeicola salanitronis]ADY36260.1 hypothetical protein Bacsa_1697 [Phocaeicola salanitronis DSM 18170]